MQKLNFQGALDFAYSAVAIALSLALGKGLYYLLGGLPGSLYGMIILNFLLHFQIVSAVRLKSSIDWAIRNMGVCFVPAGVGIINHFDLVAQHGIAIVGIIFLTTFIVISIVGLLTQKYLPEIPEKQPITAEPKPVSAETNR